MNAVTDIQTALEQGDPVEVRKLLPFVYDELRMLAAQRLAHEDPGHTLQATALVNEVYLRLVGPGQVQSFDHRGHFFAAAAEAMRRILIERARHKRRAKHGGDRQRVELADVVDPVRHAPDEILALDEGLRKLTIVDPQKARMVELRYFAGLSNEQVAEVLGISSATAKRHWRYARAWLHRELHGAAQSE
jgi:RNA polymerase sigma factor (TIGR02999 family)